jgi:L-ascorbate metabolism protein UlaG (beta-lactamase superfamily)
VPALRPLQVDVALVPINGNRPERRVAGNLDGVEAARLACEIGAELAIPHHFDMFKFNTEPPDEFVAECRRLGQNFRVLENGAGLDVAVREQGSK